MSLDVAIPHAEIYTSEMLKPLIDKMFFMDKVEATVIIDYGCADGGMLSALRRLFPEHTYIGYDESPDMIDRASANVPDVVFTSDWSHVAKLAKRHQAAGQKVCLVLSSVIHEVYSYGSPGEVAEFWARVWGDGDFRFDCVAIRDMMVSKTCSRPADPIAVARVRQVYDQKMLAEWEAQWGSLHENWSLTHFLLTYRYKENWSREVKENYLPVPFEDFMSSIPPSYMPIYHEHFTLPFIRRQVRKDFGFDLSERTHMKLVLEAV